MIALQPPTAGAATARSRLLDHLAAAVACIEPDTLEVRTANARFLEWFPPADGGASALPDRIPAFDTERARARFERGRPYSLDVTVQSGPRDIAVRLEVRSDTIADAAVLVAEAHDITAQREAEFMLDSYSRLMERQARELQQEKERAERLLLNIVPPRVAAELRDFGTTTPHSIPAASVLMLDFVGFTEMAITREPGELIAELNDVFTSFDRISEHCRCERIKTIGDAYMAVAGVPENDPDHEANIARAALRMRRFLERRNTSAKHRWQCRIGIASGPVIGSIVGVQKYVYDIFGTPVNLASRLEALADPMQVLVVSEMAERLRENFVLRPLGRYDIKGMAPQEVFALEDEARRGR